MRSSGETESRIHKMKTPIFVRGIHPRSGTNFLADILSNHSSCLVHDHGFWEFPPFRHQEKLIFYINCIKKSSHVSNLDTARLLQEFGSAWMRYFKKENNYSKAGLQHFVFKEPSIKDLDSMTSMFPESKCIIVIRNGRDIISSLLKARFTLPPVKITTPRLWRRLLPGTDFRILVDRLSDSAQILVDYLSTNSPSAIEDRLLIVHYEDLYLKPRSCIPDILEWIGVTPSSYNWNAFDHMPVRGSSFLRDKSRQINFTQGVAKTNDFSPVGRSTDWSRAMIRYYNTHALEHMQKLGSA